MLADVDILWTLTRSIVSKFLARKCSDVLHTAGTNSAVSLEKFPATI